MKILLVDDEKKFVLMLAKRLSLRGFDADYAYTGEEALDMIRKKDYEVAVLDVKMPGIGGIELRRKISEISPKMKFIFLTGHGSKQDFEVGSLEAAHYLSKPLKIENLLETLTQMTSS